MNALPSRWPVAAVVVGLVALLVAGCVVPGGGYGYDQGFGLGYYEPVGVTYGGWGGGYDVGPVRGGAYRGGRGPHAFRAAPPSRSMPSIPSRGRPGGGARGGGGRPR